MIETRNPLPADIFGEFQPPKQAVHIGPPENFCNRVARIIVLESEHEISDRKSWSSMEVTVINGSCHVEVNDETHLLKPHQNITIPPEANHRIRAITDCRAVLTFET